MINCLTFCLHTSFSLLLVSLGSCYPEPLSSGMKWRRLIGINEAVWVYFKCEGRYNKTEVTTIHFLLFHNIM